MEINFNEVKKIIIERFDNQINDIDNFNKWFDMIYAEKYPKEERIAEALFGQYLRYCVLKDRANKQIKID